MGHGSGGRMMHRLIREVIAPAFEMDQLGDAAVLEGAGEMRLVFTTDSYVISPIFFPGGDIGELAVCGTVNDLSMMGANPLYLSAGFVLEEGFLIDDMRRVVHSMAETARKAGVRIVAGDTKVVDRGKCDGIYINTAGVGTLENGLNLGPACIRPGDKVIVSGPVGTHGVAVMAERNGLTFEPRILSDTAPLNGLVRDMTATGTGIRVMRDPTRGGLATTLKEITRESGNRIVIRECEIPVLDGVRGACELLGLDPLYVANEGVLLAVVAPEGADVLLAAMRAHPLGVNAAVVGDVFHEDRSRGELLLETTSGGTRMLDMLTGEQLPRIC